VNIKKSSSILLSVALFATIAVNAQNSSSLLRSVPEKEGVSSADILQFIEAANKSKSEFHSFMLLRHGKVIAEGWWNPYGPSLRHTLYSCSKSFTATAVGFAVQEKLLKLDDKVISFFPDKLPDTVSPNLADLTVRDALMMSDGQEPDPTFTIASNNSDWIKSFLATPVKYDPGTTFLYNSLGTYMLSAIVQKVSGKPILEYLKPRFFEPLGIKDMDWEMDTNGINTGGWGLRLKTEDMAKFAQLFLQKGKWQGRQVLPQGWAEEASTMKIMQDPNAPQSKKDSSDWLQGYCYQMWRCRNNGYRGDGAYGQYMIVMPDQDAAIAITSETPDMQEELNLIWKYLLPAFKNAALPEDKSNHLKLQSALQSLSLVPSAKSNVTSAENINSKKYVFAPNDAHLKTISFSADKEIYRVHLETDTAKYILSFGEAKWLADTTSMPMPSLTATAIENTAFLYPAKTHGSFTWKDAHSLQLVLRYIESPHSEKFTCNFDGNKLTVNVEKSIDFGTEKTTLTAEMDQGK
jgi:CubicO group peptidase (beta-lactamase class C family)